MAAMATLFIFLGVTRPPREKSDIKADEKDIYGKIKQKLMSAGLTETSPAMIVTATIIGMVFSLFVVALLVHNIFAGMAAAMFTPLIVWTWLNRQKRKYQDRINAALVPFLRQIESQVVAGQNAAAAFRYAVEKSPLFSALLSEKMHELRLNRPFMEVLLSTQEVLPVRGWVQFVKAMEIQTQSGGNLGDMINSAVHRINSRLLLQETIRGKYKTIAGQQKIILAAGIFMPFFFYLSAPAVFNQLFTSIMGILGLGFGIAMIVLGALLSRHTVKEIEGRINY